MRDATPWVSLDHLRGLPVRAIDREFRAHLDCLYLATHPSLHGKRKALSQARIPTVVRDPGRNGGLPPFEFVDGGPFLHAPADPLGIFDTGVLDPPGVE